MLVLVSCVYVIIGVIDHITHTAFIFNRRVR